MFYLGKKNNIKIFLCKFYEQKMLGIRIKPGPRNEKKKRQKCEPSPGWNEILKNWLELAMKLEVMHTPLCHIFS